MQYKNLKELFHTLNHEQYTDEIEHRKSSFATISLPIPIKDHATGRESPAFLVCTWEIPVLMQSIQHSIGEIEASYATLPPVARRYYIQKCLVDEIQTTNDIEGIYSTKKEINDTIVAVKESKSSKQKRFYGMIKKYSVLLANADTEIDLNSSTDLRHLYNEVVLPEISPDLHPDGLIFRTTGVEITSFTGQVRHKGILPEEKIIEYTDKALGILQDIRLPELVKIALLHYYIGYIHPFYDGNGRIDRFISSYLIFKKLNPLVALDFSHTIKENKKKYYKAFQACNESRNAGDLTPFVITFIEFVAQAGVRVARQLCNGVEKLEHYQKQTTRLVELLSSNDKMRSKIHQMLFHFVQNSLFSPTPFTLKELVENSNWGTSTVTKTLNYLIDTCKIPISVASTKPREYRLDLDKFDDYVQSLLEKHQ